MLETRYEQNHCSNPIAETNHKNVAYLDLFHCKCPLR